MTKTAYRIMARNERTKQRIAQQFLDGTVVENRETAWELAQQLAEKQSQRDRTTWLPEIETYQPRK